MLLGKLEIYGTTVNAVWYLTECGMIKLFSMVSN